MGGTTSTFTFACHICGTTCQVTDGVEEPHRCRIEISVADGDSLQESWAQFLEIFGGLFYVPRMTDEGAAGAVTEG